MKRTDVFDSIPEPATPDDLASDLPELAEWVSRQSARDGGRHEVRCDAGFAIRSPTLYMETAIVSYMTSWLNRDATVARRQSVIRDWWRRHRIRHLIYTSEVVIGEASRGDPFAARRRLEILRKLPRVHVSPQSHELAELILAHCRLPARLYDDAQHVALCALHGLDVLLTWNCKHLANEHMLPFIGRACEAYGYAPPTILTPEQLIGVCAYG